MPKTFTLALQAFVLAALIANPALAKTTKDQAPPPPAVPVPQVDAEALPPPGPTKLDGTAQVVDGDEIRVGDSLVRLYGIAAPDMTAKLGPEARVALDGLVGGQRVTCLIFDKTPQGNGLGKCMADTADPAEALLTKGLAAVYRNGNPSDPAQQALTTKYDAAEAVARKQAVGLWQPPVPQVDPHAAAAERSKARILGFAGFALLILSIFTVSITQLSIARRDRNERRRLQEEHRTTLSYTLAAEVEIVLATARRLIEHIPGLPTERPLPAAVSAALTLPSTTFWQANAERLHLLPADVAIPLLRFHALCEDVGRKLAVASAMPSGALVTLLNSLVETGAATVATIEASLGIVKPAEPTIKPSETNSTPPSSTPSSELKPPARPATN